MKNQQSSPGAETPVVDLQRMAFEKLKDDGHEAALSSRLRSPTVKCQTHRRPYSQ